jgi:TRAP-type C4-dicarboxylate transport system permease small subunit
MDMREDSRNWVDYSLGVLVATVVVLALVEVLSRYVLHYSFFFSEEITRFLFIWMVFLGGSVGVKRATHFKLDAFARKMGASSERRFLLTRDSCVVLFSVLLLIGGIRVVELNMRNLSPATALPMGYVYAIVPISAALSIYYAARQLILTLRLVSGGPGSHVLARDESSPQGGH